MDTDPQYERLDDTPKEAGRTLPPATKKRIESLLKQGTPPAETARLVAVEGDVVRGIRNNLQDSGQLDLLAFKRRTAARLASFIDKGLNRLDSEVDTIPIGQLMLSAAIAIDKLDKVTDAAPTVNVKAELKISADDINKLLGFGGPIIDIPAEKKPPE
jgi:hypothetical protein